jgi:hypothetical protein
MLNTIAKRIQSRLSRLGVKVALSEIKSQCEGMIKDIKNPSEEDLLAVQGYFMNSANQLTVIPDVHTSSIQELEDVHTASIQDTDSIDLYTNEAALDTEEVIAPQTDTQTEPAPLATTPKGELVANTADQMGISLNTQEMELIAQNVNYSSDDLQESLDEIKNAIIAFIQHRIATNSQKIGETLEEISQVATDGFSANSQQLTEGLQHINQQLQEQSRDFKSKVKSTLSVFQLPAAS